MYYLARPNYFFLNTSTFLMFWIYQNLFGKMLLFIIFFPLFCSWSSKIWKTKWRKRCKHQIATKFSTLEPECFCSGMPTEWHFLTFNKKRILVMSKFPNADTSSGLQTWPRWHYCPNIALPFATKKWKYFALFKKTPASSLELGTIKASLCTRPPTTSSTPSPTVTTASSAPWTCQSI